MNGDCDGAKNGTVDQLVLAFPELVRRVGGGCASSVDCLRGCSDGSVDVTGEIVSIKQRMYLTAPHQVIRGCEFGDIRHVDIEKSWCFRESNGFRGSSWCGSHRETKRMKREARREAAE